MTLASVSSIPAVERPLLDQLDMAFPLRHLVFPEARTAVRECGQGPTVVLLHGIGSGAASWLQVARQLSGQARVIAWDAPGYGRSSPLAEARPRAESYARRLEHVLEALEIGRCVLVGHSLGAMTALACATGQAASRIARVMLISPARGYGAAARRAIGEQVRAGRLDHLERHGVEAMAEERSHRLLSTRASASQLDWVRWNMARLNPAGYRQAVELLCGDDLLRFPPLTMPCEVHCGEDDGITQPGECQLIADHLHARFSLIPRAGHASPIEQPEAVTERIASALKASLEGTRP
ncbi:alpha/beta hydrolase [Stutzerimonas nosocomialis]|uniref:alpha/beta fold hydrolase n=1 Tax=Stutzerimonas nosocomialis TaxID=1056496 RepID=UPI001107E683|nr:alpha/beta hydrolase [Stutzerimonas nosocomialis]